MLDVFFHGMTPLQLTGLVFCAWLIGINKTGIPGLGTLPVVILTLLFPARFSTGIQLVMLCTADVVAVLYYRRNANWKLLAKLFPAAFAGIGIGVVTLRFLDDAALSVAIGVILIVMVLLHFIKTKLVRSDAVPEHWLFIVFAGIAAGFATQIANTAGPVVALYLLSMRLPKEEYIGTSVFFFFLMNWIKLPIFIAEGRVGVPSLLACLPMIPVLLAGAACGVWLFRKFTQKSFENIIQAVVLASAVYLVFSHLIRFQLFS